MLEEVNKYTRMRGRVEIHPLKCKQGVKQKQTDYPYAVIWVFE